MLSVLAAAGAALLTIGVSAGVPLPPPGPIIPKGPVITVPATATATTLAAALDRTAAQVGDSLKLVIFVGSSDGNPVPGVLTVTEKVQGQTDRVLATDPSDNFLYGSQADRTVAIPVTRTGTVALLIGVQPTAGTSNLPSSTTVTYSVPAPAIAPTGGGSKGGGSTSDGSNPGGAPAATTPAAGSAAAESPTASPSSRRPSSPEASASDEKAVGAASSDTAPDGQAIWIVLIVCITVLLLAGGAVLVLTRRRV